MENKDLFEKIAIQLLLNDENPYYDIDNSIPQDQKAICRAFDIATIIEEAKQFTSKEAFLNAIKTKSYKK
jgi:hypothetical protein